MTTMTTMMMMVVVADKINLKSTFTLYYAYFFIYYMTIYIYEGEATRLAELSLISITYFTYIFKTSCLFFSIPFSGGFFIFAID